MAGANSNIQVTDLDFNNIKNNLKTFLQSQETLKDYNYEGSALSTLLDVLAYNTQYNAYYLNMVANEMFLDSAIQRDSVLSHAKLLNYTPKSATAPTATISLLVNNVNTPTLTLPKYTNFISEAIDGINYNFITTTDTTVNTSANAAFFPNVTIAQGTPTSISYVVDSTSNPTFTFKIPDVGVDTSTLLVTVQQASTNTSFDTYTLGTDILGLDGTSQVYFLQEGLGGLFEVYFGDGVIGQQLSDGNIVRLSYVVTQGTSATGANNFILLNSVNGYTSSVVTPVTAATQGSAKESIQSIKFQAPKAFSAQGRAVTKDDYITVLQQNTLGFPFDAVNVWGGEENNPPVYGQVFIAVKPRGGYSLTEVQKTKLITDVIQNISVMTVTPTIVDPDYTYVQITANVLYDTKKTNLTASQLQTQIKVAIATYAQSTLNTFNSTFLASDFNTVINNVNGAIITNELSLQVQKKFYPNLTTPTTYTLNYGVPLKRGMFQSGIYSSPPVAIKSPLDLVSTIDGVYLEEVPTSTGGVSSISILNTGFGYQYAPTVTIKGDGTGATAIATINANGTLKSIIVTNAGSGYSSAIAVITPANNDTTGQLGAAVVNLEGQFGTLRTYYNNTDNVKTVINNNVGTIDYTNGIVTINSFAPIQVDNDLGQFTVSASPTTTIFSSTYNRIITVDPYDSNAIVVNVTPRT